MKKLFLAFAVFALIMASCKEEATGPQEEAYAEFTVTANSADFVTLKSAPLVDENLPVCNDSLSLDYAELTYTIGEGDTTTVMVPIYEIEGKYVTQPVQVVLGSEVSVIVNVEEFIIYHQPEVGDPIPVKAAPHSGTAFYDFVNPDHVLGSYELKKFMKQDIIIDVLCYDELVYDYFGFVWFQIHPITIRNMCVFGDICVCEPGSYELPYGNMGALYTLQNDMLFDLVAITQVVITKEDGWTKTYSNIDHDWADDENDGYDCVAVYWPDIDGESDEVTIEIQVLLPVGTGLEWVTVKTFTGEAGDDFAGGDDMLDFVIGDCHSSADWVLPAHLHLPNGEVTVDMTVTSYNFNGSTDYHYMYVNLEGIPEGYSISDGDYASWCADKAGRVTIGNTYTGVQLFAAATWAGADHLNTEKLDKLNWLINNLPTSLDIYRSDFTDNQKRRIGKMLQTLIWRISENNNAINDWNFSGSDATLLSDVMASVDLNVNAMTRFIPEPGMKQAVMFYKNERVQVLFTSVSSPCVEVFQ